MIEETARVVAVGEGFARVTTERRTACGACSLKQGCGTGALARVVGNRYTEVRAIDSLGVELGERVVIGIQDDALLKGSLATYAVPLGAMIALALVAEVISGGGDPAALLGGVAGFLLGLLWLYRFARAAARDGRYQPQVLRRLGTPAAADGVLAP